MQALLYVLVFLSGVITTLAVLLAYGWYVSLKERVRLAEEAQEDAEAAIKYVKQQNEEAAAQLQQSIAEMVKRRQAAAMPPPPVPPDASNNPSVKDRIRKAVELTTKQSAIDPKQGPEFQEKHNELELEKIAVLKSILADGFDPPITIRLDSGVKEMLLSTYVQSLSKGLA